MTTTLTSLAPVLNKTAHPIDCVLFLDFDGVTHAEPYAKKDEHGRLPLIEAVLREFPQVDMVISSSWREQYSLVEMQGFFAPDMAARVIGQTPSMKQATSTWLPGQGSGFEREREIEAWMSSHCTWDTPWLAIDDRPYWFRPNSANLLVTQARTGFTPDDQATLRTLLTERM